MKRGGGSIMGQSGIASYLSRLFHSHLLGLPPHPSYGTLLSSELAPSAPPSYLSGYLANVSEMLD